MATMIYNCKRCKVGRRVEYPIRVASWNGSRAQMYRYDDDHKKVAAGVWIESSGGGKPTRYGGDPLGVCPQCGHKMEFSFLVATMRPGVACDARCTGARGHTCDCSCGGKNHGAGWSVQLGAPLADVLKRAARSEVTS
jgi:hypothetical protein